MEAYGSKFAEALRDRPYFHGDEVGAHSIAYFPQKNRLVQNLNPCTFPWFHFQCLVDAGWCNRLQLIRHPRTLSQSRKRLFPRVYPVGRQVKHLAFSYDVVIKMMNFYANYFWSDLYTMRTKTNRRNQFFKQLFSYIESVSFSFPFLFSISCKRNGRSKNQVVNRAKQIPIGEAPQPYCTPLTPQPHTVNTTSTH